MQDQIRDAILAFKDLDLTARIEAINEVKSLLKQVSPFTTEPVECVQWVSADKVIANDYNPNSVAPPEMELLHTSIQEDGYTQPIVVWQHDGIYEVVDGFHRNRVGKEYADIKERVHGHLPVVVINNEREDKGDRIASTIRHNRARGKHSVDGMSQIVIDLKRRNWSDKKIAKELGQACCSCYAGIHEDEVREAWGLLTNEQRVRANIIATVVIKEWLRAHEKQAQMTLFD